MITTTEERVAETFQTRLDAPGDECAHARFPEVWNNSELSRELIDQAFGAVAGMYDAMGAMVTAGALSTDEGIFSRWARHSTTRSSCARRSATRSEPLTRWTLWTRPSPTT
jgi:hypothetical protein